MGIIFKDAAVVSAVCGAPTTDERIHAPVLHDASQIGLLQVLRPASLSPITSRETNKHQLRRPQKGTPFDYETMASLMSRYL